MKAIKLLKESQESNLRLAEDYHKKADYAAFSKNAQDLEMYIKWANDYLNKAREIEEAIEEIESLKQLA